MSDDIEMDSWEVVGDEWAESVQGSRAARRRDKRGDERDDDDTESAAPARSGNRRRKGTDRRRDLEDRLEKQRLQRDLYDYYDDF